MEHPEGLESIGGDWLLVFCRVFFSIWGRNAQTVESVYKGENLVGTAKHDTVFFPRYANVVEKADGFTLPQSNILVCTQKWWGSH